MIANPPSPKLSLSNAIPWLGDFQIPCGLEHGLGSSAGKREEWTSLLIFTIMFSCWPLGGGPWVCGTAWFGLDTFIDGFTRKGGKAQRSARDESRGDDE
jgi:hypothetical protein